MHTHRLTILGTYLFLTAICLWLVSFPAYATSRGIMLKAKTATGTEKEIRLYSGYYALVIGCGDYQRGWPSLPNPVKDAMQVAALLSSMGWTVDVLKNPDGNTFQRTLNKLVAGPGRNRDMAILLWFSGHGHTIEEADGTKLGYLVPVDAPDPNKDLFGFLERAISMRRIETVSKQIRSKHVLMAFDSCFSGAIFQMVRSRPSPYIQEKVSYPVRQFITAGMENEQVPDKSVFKDVFIQGIKEGFADLNKDSYITAQELGAYLQEKVTNYSRRSQHPQFGKINNPKLDKGDFVFVLKSSEPSSQSDRITSVLEAEKKRLAEEAARIERERQELDELKALIEQRKELEAQSRKLEDEKRAVIESSRKEREIQKPETQTTKIQTTKIQVPESEKEKIAAIPKKAPVYKDTKPSSEPPYRIAILPWMLLDRAIYYQIPTLDRIIYRIEKFDDINLDSSFYKISKKSLKKTLIVKTIDKSVIDSSTIDKLWLKGSTYRKDMPNVELVCQIGRELNVDAVLMLYMDAGIVLHGNDSVKKLIIHVIDVHTGQLCSAKNRRQISLFHGYFFDELDLLVSKVVKSYLKQRL
ncbi:MAG: caspase family protein [Desulfobacteraceae bacterium]|jgi:uncharacterized caspase-like protein